MSAKKGSKSRRVRYLSFLNLGCRFGCWHWLLLPSEGFWLFWQHLWLCLRHQFFLNTTPPPKKKKRKEIHTKQAFVFVQWSGFSEMRTRAYKPRGSSWGGAHSTPHSNSPGAMGVPLELGPWSKRRQKFWPMKCSGKAQLCAGVLGSNAVQDRIAQRRMKATSLKSSFVRPDLRTTLLIVF